MNSGESRCGDSLRRVVKVGVAVPVGEAGPDAVEEGAARQRGMAEGDDVVVDGREKAREACDSV
jgi:hypothetical protein